MSKNTFDHAARNAKPDCPKCHGTGQFKYDHNHSTICGLCCRHDLDWWQLTEGHGPDAGKWCCLGGCGKILADKPEK